jgi:hypothetical protein
MHSGDLVPSALRSGGGGTPHPAVPPPESTDRDQDGAQRRLDHAGLDQGAGSDEVKTRCRNGP